MQPLNTIVIIALEISVVLTIGATVLFIYIRKLKSLINRQQEKLLILLHERQNLSKPPAPAAAPKLSSKPIQTYKSYLNDVLDATSKQYSLIFPSGDIGSVQQNTDSSLLQRALALRYAFLRAEELGTTEPIGSTEYWEIFQQALEPLLTTGDTNNQELKNELDACKKRIENLEKFKRLFIEMEKQWAGAEANAENYFEQLTYMSNDVANQQGFIDILQQYHGVYGDVRKTIADTANDFHPDDTKTTINIIRQDPRTSEEINA